jgi:RHS repeat-associated protein
VVGSTSYDAYGNVTGSTGVQSPVGYAAGYTDAETGFLYEINRYYDPATGQWLTRDPLVALTRSSYGYVDDNPINGRDQSGLCPAVLDASTSQNESCWALAKSLASETLQGPFGVTTSPPASLQSALFQAAAYGATFVAAFIECLLKGPPDGTAGAAVTAPSAPAAPAQSPAPAQNWGEGPPYLVAPLAPSRAAVGAALGAIGAAIGAAVKAGDGVLTDLAGAL